MYKNYLIDHIIRSTKNHPLTSCKWDSIIINTTNNQLIQDQKNLIHIFFNFLTLFGQYPKIKRAKKNHSIFKIRTGLIIGTLITLKNLQLKNFLNKFIFSILPNLKTWPNLQVQKQNKDFYIINIGFENLNFWYELKNLYQTGLHIQLIIKHKAKYKDFKFFLSKYNLKI